MSTEQKKSVTRTRRHSHASYRVYIQRVLKQIYPDTGISSRALSIMEGFIAQLYDKFAIRISELLGVHKRSTITSREVQSAVLLFFPGELAKHGIIELVRAITRFNAHASTKPDSAETKKAGTEKGHINSRRANLIFPIAKCGRDLSKKVAAGRGGRVGMAGRVAIAAVIEYIITEILELAGNVSRDMKHKRITPRNILFAIKGDEELDYLFHDVIIPFGGVVPHIHSALVKKTKKELE